MSRNLKRPYLRSRSLPAPQWGDYDVIIEFYCYFLCHSNAETRIKFEINEALYYLPQKHNTNRLTTVVRFHLYRLIRVVGCPYWLWTVLGGLPWAVRDGRQNKAEICTISRSNEIEIDSETGFITRQIKSSAPVHLDVSPRYIHCAYLRRD